MISLPFKISFFPKICDFIVFKVLQKWTCIEPETNKVFLNDVHKTYFRDPDRS